MSKLRDEIDEIDQKITDLAVKKGKLLEGYLEEICPIQIGQKVEVEGWAHQGKMMIVDRRRIVSGFGSKYKWEVSGKVVNKNGSISKTNRGEIAQRHVSWR